VLRMSTRLSVSDSKRFEARITEVGTYDALQATWCGCDFRFKRPKARLTAGMENGWVSVALSEWAFDIATMCLASPMSLLFSDR